MKRFQVSEALLNAAIIRSFSCAHSSASITLTLTQSGRYISFSFFEVKSGKKLPYSNVVYGVLANVQSREKEFYSALKWPNFAKFGHLKDGIYLNLAIC